MSQRLQGKTAFVTAAGQGIGRAVAEAFAREGAKVIATDLNTGLLDSLAGTPGVTVEKLDAMDPAAISAAAQKHGGVNVLFNGAGFVHAGTVLDCTEAEWDFAFNLNVRSQFRLIKAFVPGMLTQGGGSIINVASVAGSIKGAPNRFVIFDSPPALAASPAAELAKYVGQAVVVARADRTGTGALEDAVSLLSACPNIGLLLNAVHFSPSGRRFGSYYGYGG